MEQAAGEGRVGVRWLSWVCCECDSSISSEKLMLFKGRQASADDSQEEVWLSIHGVSEWLRRDWVFEVVLNVCHFDKTKLNLNRICIISKVGHEYCSFVPHVSAYEYCAKVSYYEIAVGCCFFVLGTCKVISWWVPTFCLCALIDDSFIELPSGRLGTMTW